MEVVALVLMLVAAFVIGNSLFGSLISLLIAMVLWMLTGNVAGYIIRGKDYGVAGNIALGLLGGIVGSLTLNLLGMGRIMGIPLLGHIIAGVFGAVLFVYLMRFTMDRNFGK